MGYIISSMTGIPFSITAHRWDIADNNLLIPKARQCKFIRVIDEPGYEEMIENIGEEYRDKCFKIHVGVDIKTFDNNVDEIYNEDKLNFVIAANFVEKKGHIYLIEALNMLNKKGYDFKVCFYGDGPLEEELKKKVLEFSLQDKVIFGGKIGHDILLNKYKDGEVNCFILPSIVASDGDREGIPVSLMEAMAAKIPVISTFTGGIKELVDGSTGIAIEQKDSNALAGAIESLILNKELRRNLGEEGFNRVMEEFHISKVTDKLLNLFIEN